MSGSAVVVDFFTQIPNLQLVAGGIVVTSALMNVVFEWPRRARDFALRQQRYTDLLERMERLGSDISQQELRDVSADFVSIESDEPATNHALDSICHEEECISRNIAVDPSIRPWFLQRWFANWFDVPSLPCRTSKN